MKDCCLITPSYFNDQCLIVYAIGLIFKPNGSFPLIGPIELRFVLKLVAIPDSGARSTFQLQREDTVETYTKQLVCKHEEEMTNLQDIYRCVTDKKTKSV